MLESAQYRTGEFFSDYSFTSSMTALKSRALRSLRHKAAHLSLYHKFFHGSPRTTNIVPAFRCFNCTNHDETMYRPPAHTFAHLSSFGCQRTGMAFPRLLHFIRTLIISNTLLKNSSSTVWAHPSSKTPSGTFEVLKINRLSLGRFKNIYWAEAAQMQKEITLKRSVTKFRN